MKKSETTLVWDLPVRLGHWLLVSGFIVAWVTRDSEVSRLVHARAGIAVFAIVSFRLVWGIVGAKYAQFKQFVRGPNEVVRYLRSLFSGRPHAHVGHNPAGAIAIVTLLTLAFITTVSGWLTYNGIGDEFVADAHEALAELMLATVILHILGVVIGSYFHRENLVTAMISGRKNGETSLSIKNAFALPAALLLIWTILCGYFLAL